MNRIDVFQASSCPVHEGFDASCQAHSAPTASSAARRPKATWREQRPSKRRRFGVSCGRGQTGTPNDRTHMSCPRLMWLLLPSGATKHGVHAVPGIYPVPLLSEQDSHTKPRQLAPEISGTNRTKKNETLPVNYRPRIRCIEIQ